MDKRNSKGFTLIEIMMVLILIAVLAAVAINSFINFRLEAREAALRSNLKAMRATLTAQYSQMQLRCSASATQFPAVASIVANDITDGNSVCDNTMVPNAPDRKFYMGDAVPQNPFVAESVLNTTVTACAGAGCNRTNGTECGGGGGTGSNHWCYDEATGYFWLDRDNYKDW
jgi:prepilin-type N-terminal cleavage/methylation domain-containing protein